MPRCQRAGQSYGKKCGCHAEWALREQRPVDIRTRPIRNECRSCHSVDPDKKLGDDATHEEAEVETGQEGLDD